MAHIWNRRTFLRRCARAGAGTPLLPLLGCGSESSDGSGAGADRAVRGLSTPLLYAVDGDAVRVVSAVEELPIAYVSRRLMQVFVNRTFRDRASFVLHAHISVSTGLWRIPLPGDPADEPITPGDGLREFEELDISEWDPMAAPGEGDFRLRLGHLVRESLHFDCVPVLPAGGWVTGGPFDVLRYQASGDTCREDFRDVGPAARYSTRGCGTEEGTVRVMMWAGLGE